MTEPRKVPLEILPGIIKITTDREAKNRYIAGDKVRFWKGRPQKIGGWTGMNDNDNLFGGFARSMLAYIDFNFNPWLIVGTNERLYQYDQDWVRTNITPFIASGTLTDPFTTTNTSVIVNVTDVAHGLVVGQYVNFDGAAAVGGITIDGEYQVTSVVDADNYTITHSAAATSTAGPGGGAGVDYDYELAPGNSSTTMGGGWGIGGWGEGTYGTEHASATFFQNPRQWHLDKYGENTIALVNGGTVYQWDPDTSTDRAVAVTNAPTGEAMFITSERTIVVLGANADLMLMNWSDDNDITIWTAAEDNIANTRRLQEGSRMVGGGRLAQRVNVVWTDTALYLMQFTGSSTVYDTRLVARNCGLIGAFAHAEVNGVAYWMSGGRLFYFNGTVSEIPKQEEVADYVFAGMEELQAQKVTCHYNPFFNEIWWLYPALGSNENDRYVAVSLDDFSWTVGTLDRTASTVRLGITGTIYMTDTNGRIYEHEVALDADGGALNWSLETGLVEIDEGNQSFNVWGYIPDMKRQVGSIDLTFTAYDYPEDTAAIETLTTSIPINTGIIDFQMSGYEVKLLFSGTGVGCDFRFGAQRLEASEAGSRR